MFDFSVGGHHPLFGLLVHKVVTTLVADVRHLAESLLISSVVEKKLYKSSPNSHKLLLSSKASIAHTSGKQ